MSGILISPNFSGTYYQNYLYLRENIQVILGNTSFKLLKLKPTVSVNSEFRSLLHPTKFNETKYWYPFVSQGHKNIIEGK